MDLLFKKRSMLHALTKACPVLHLLTDAFYPDTDTAETIKLCMANTCPKLAIVQSCAVVASPRVMVNSLTTVSLVNDVCNETFAIYNIIQHCCNTLCYLSVLWSAAAEGLLHSPTLLICIKCKGKKINMTMWSSAQSIHATRRKRSACCHANLIRSNDTVGAMRRQNACELQCLRGTYQCSQQCPL